MTFRPGDQQLQALRELNPARSLLVQYQLKGDSGSDDLVQGIRQSGGRLLSHARVDLLAVGETEKSWSGMLLAEFPDRALLESHITDKAVTAALGRYEDVTVLIASPPPPKVRKVISLLNRVIPWLPGPRKGGELPESELNGGINPTVAQMQAFRGADQKCPIHMFNLLKFHDRARYEDGDHGKSGQQAYEQGYGKVAVSCFLRLGGAVVALGRYRLTLIGAGDDPAPEAWDEVAIVQYPNRPAFEHMVSNPRYQSALVHRHAGLAMTELWSTAPHPEFVL